MPVFPQMCRFVKIVLENLHISLHYKYIKCWAHIENIPPFAHSSVIRSS